MGKPGQRPTAIKKDLIIDQPALQTLWQKYSYGLFTLMAWTFWLYLWLPLISLLAWLFGINLFYEHMIVLGGYVGLLQLLGMYTAIIFVIGMTLLIWAFYNQFRFKGKERRESTPPVENRDVARFFSISVEKLQKAQIAKRLEISFDEEGNIIQID